MYGMSGTSEQTTKRSSRPRLEASGRCTRPVYIELPRPQSAPRGRLAPVGTVGALALAPGLAWALGALEAAFRGSHLCNTSCPTHVFLESGE